MHECLKLEAAASEKALESAQRAATSALGTWDEWDEHVRAAKTKLVAANRDFGAYRDAQCALAASLAGGSAGRTTEVLRLSCVAEMNASRAKHLASMVADLPKR